MPTATPLPTPAKLDRLDYVRWEVGDQVSEDMRDTAKEGVQLMHDYAVRLGMSRVDRDVTVHFHKDLEKLSVAYARYMGRTVESARTTFEKNVATAPGSEIFVNAGNSWYAKTEPKYQMKVIAHELFHIYQESMTAHGGHVDEPIWLSEGTAEYLAYKALSHGGILSYESERTSRFVKKAKTNDAPLRGLATYEIIGELNSPYQYFLLAAELLASRSGEESLIHYYSLAQPGTTWQESFQNAFGMTVDDFYQLFEEHRAAGFPEVELP